MSHAKTMRIGQLCADSLAFSSTALILRSVGVVENARTAGCATVVVRRTRRNMVDVADTKQEGKACSSDIVRSVLYQLQRDERARHETGR